jgi:hypothetical protein
MLVLFLCLHCSFTLTLEEKPLATGFTQELAYEFMVFISEDQILATPFGAENLDRLDLQQKTVRQVLTSGNGPDEIAPGKYWIRASKAGIFIEELLENRFKRLNPDGSLTVLFDLEVLDVWLSCCYKICAATPTKIFALRDSTDYRNMSDEFIDAVYRKWGVLRDDRALLGWFLYQENQFQLQGFLYPENLEELRASGLFFSRTRLVESIHDEIFVVHGWGANDVVVLDENGGERRRFPIPHYNTAVKRRLPDTPEMRVLWYEDPQLQAQGYTTTDVKSDRHNRLHFLMARTFVALEPGMEPENLSGRLIVVTDDRGNVLSQYKLPFRVWSFAMPPSGDYYLALNPVTEEWMLLTRPSVPETEKPLD